MLDKPCDFEMRYGGQVVGANLFALNTLSMLIN
jgi:hypothetical protein